MGRSKQEQEHTPLQFLHLRKSRSRMVVRGRTKAWSPPRRSVRINEHAREAGKPVKGKIMRSFVNIELLAIHS